VKEIRLHGRGGQGVVMASDILANAFVAEGMYATAFPSFGVERRGAPVSAFVRLDDKDIRERSQIYSPDCLIFTDPFFKNVNEVYAGLKPDGILILNSPEPIKGSPNQNVKRVGAIDAIRIALKEIKRPATNTCLIGAFAATTGWVGLDSILSALNEFWSGKALEGNKQCARRGYEEVQLTEY
jgi:2-oxoacid:acceptor oxidoreductase gamma subunit (pyruvate/2-ketoisovalerate family)